MESELTDFAQTAGATLVTLMATDAFQGAKQAVLELWRKIRPSETASVSDQMEATRTALIQARSQRDAECEKEFAAWWQERLALLFAADRRAIQTLYQALTEITSDEAAHAKAPPASSMQMSAKARDKARIYQAGRDLHIMDH